jgi:hypothetical protein
MTLSSNQWVWLENDTCRIVVYDWWYGFRYDDVIFWEEFIRTPNGVCGICLPELLISMGWWSLIDRWRGSCPAYCDDWTRGIFYDYSWFVGLRFSLKNSYSLCLKSGAIYALLSWTITSSNPFTLDLTMLPFCETIALSSTFSFLKKSST